MPAKHPPVQTKFSIVKLLTRAQASTVLPHIRPASSIKGHKQKEHLLALELLQKNPSFCKLVQSNQVPAPNKLKCK